MPANQYDKNNLITISALFKHLGVATDPTTVTLKIKKPDGSTQTYTYALAEIIKDSTGAYHKDITNNIPGDWYYYWEGTGAVVASSETYFITKPSEFS